MQAVNQDGRENNATENVKQVGLGWTVLPGVVDVLETDRVTTKQDSVVVVVEMDGSDQNATECVHLVISEHDVSLSVVTVITVLVTTLQANVLHLVLQAGMEKCAKINVQTGHMVLSV